MLQSVPQPHSQTNPFIVQLADALPAGEVTVSWFTWRTALLTSYDVVHAHWPELAMRGTGRLRATAQRVMFALWVLRLMITRTPVVRTLHNTSPHDAGTRLETLLVRWFDARTVTWIRLNDLTDAPSGGRVVTIPHGHYIDWLAAYRAPAPVPGRILFFGHIRPYKGFEELLASFGEFRDAAATLHIVGSPQNEAVRARISEAAAADPRISATLGYAEDRVLVHEIGEAQLVVLPYRQLLNSGSMLLALSAARPVLVPSGAVARALREEVGASWVLSFDPPLSAADLRDALTASASTGRAADVPDLSGRDWPALGAALYEEYRYAATIRGRPYSE